MRNGDESTQGDGATGRTTIVTAKGAEVPVDYRLTRKDGRWLVYDVSIEALASSTTIAPGSTKIIRSSSYWELVQRMEKKTVPEPKTSSAGS